MPPTLDSLAAVLDPVLPDQFFAEHYGKRVLHVPGEADKFADLMSWEVLNDLLSMEIWSATSLRLVLDKKMLPPEAYCRKTHNRNNEDVLAPAPDLVMEWGRRGASLVLHDIEDLVGTLAATKSALEQAFLARGAINLYCSWQGRQAFDTHFDTHDVFAFQIAGEKIWRVYSNRFDNPVEHASFKNLPQAFFDENRGSIAEEIRMRPGSLLYLPRGTYHDALTVAETSIHLVFALIEPVGLVWLTAMWTSPWRTRCSDPCCRASQGLRMSCAFTRISHALPTSCARSRRAPGGWSAPVPCGCRRPSPCAIICRSAASSRRGAIR
jgi:bifunctional lysine-specific demethylase and histidyl-hydroxylase MINA